ncbi:pyridoxal phosphate-dependent transferase [Cantharellus anzutake]|uniref:pyridoxal phosphate-dependent transferase n=1 Tax=Cantharellus anzutake TaxID=1750568 RepID=UPI00190519E4|nr:pyridoxal phosphate-dependent transferase [Cantharellus anzutake]KAF8340328.1 pyridoxal phosphate-dependent transferase [Cantharellus anzutake]
MYSDEFYSAYISDLSKTRRKSPKSTLTIGGPGSSADLSEALQYGFTQGHTDLVEWISDFQARAHQRPQDGSWKLSIGAGSQDLLYKAFLALTNPGDSVLIEAPVYAGVIPLLISAKANLIEIATDHNGIEASSLRSILEAWPPNKPLPKYLYTVPYGCNPSGATASLERRRQVLTLARKYKFLILEDDPYYWMYYGDAPRSPSYFKLEAQEPSEEGTGLVLRFDSFSKILSSGLRIGFASGPAPLLGVMNSHTASANLQPSSLSQSVTLAILRHWGSDGFIAHTEQVSKFYRQRKEVFEAAMYKHMVDDDGTMMAEWTSPVSGMFLWFKLLISPNLFGEITTIVDDEGDSKTLIETNAFEAGVLALPGTVFFAIGRKTAYVRVSFSVLNDADTWEAVRRLSVVVREARKAKR